MFHQCKLVKLLYIEPHTKNPIFQFNVVFTQPKVVTENDEAALLEELARLEEENKERSGDDSNTDDSDDEDDDEGEGEEEVEEASTNK